MYKIVLLKSIWLYWWKILCNNVIRRDKSIIKKDKIVEYYLLYFSRNLYG